MGSLTTPHSLLLFSFFLFIGMNFCLASTETASQYILMDATTGRVLRGKNYNTPMLIASITKILTCVLAIESLKLDDIVVVDDIVNSSYGSGIYIEIGEEISLRSLLYGLMLRSGNDAAVMIAKFVGGDIENFVVQMNAKAREIGMSNSIFVNPSGLDNTDGGNYSTAYDMALLTKYAMQNDEYRKIVSTKTYTVKTNKKTYVWKNKNKLLFSYEYTTGGKTGFTEHARRTLVTTATKNNMNVVVVTLNDPNDFKEHKEAFEY